MFHYHYPGLNLCRRCRHTGCDLRGTDVFDWNDRGGYPSPDWPYPGSLPLDEPTRQCSRCGEFFS